MYHVHVSIDKNKCGRHRPYFQRDVKTLKEALDVADAVVPLQSAFHVKITITGAAEAAPPTLQAKFIDAEAWWAARTGYERATQLPAGFRTDAFFHGGWGTLTIAQQQAITDALAAEKK